MNVRCHDMRCMREECFGQAGPFCLVLAEEFSPYERCPFYKGRSQAVIDRRKAVGIMQKHGFLREAVAMYGRQVLGE